MIIDGLASILMAILSPLIQLLPEANITDSMPAPGNVAYYISTVDVWVPIRGPLKFLATILSWGQLFIPVALFVWVWKLIPGKMT